MNIPSPAAAPRTDASADASPESERTATWVVIVPVKPTAIGKSRLVAAGPDRTALARAIALDTIAAAGSATHVAHVVVVTNDADICAALESSPRVTVVGEGATPGLNLALATGAEAARTVAPHASRAALLGDVPALRPDDLDEALRGAARYERAVVADTEGTGSTLMTVRGTTDWHSAFGPESFVRHTELGCIPLPLPAHSTVRRDVDTAEQLTAAAALGLGPHTTALLTPHLG